MTELEQMGQRARDAAEILKNAGARKNKALEAIADALVNRSEEILS